ncbi:hypothetical protein AC578_6496 [Pseudocercospora eumusae]|uniref:Uncharacterized protein n=1 Tax=Pseudocercospora eumusae TaxID=321146 RepID=A0A139HHQ3_9PEZI|nr:hypothetical protein AC578_6496 [Pseudocercospora eumusae]
MFASRSSSSPHTGHTTCLNVGDGYIELCEEAPSISISLPPLCVEIHGVRRRHTDGAGVPAAVLACEVGLSTATTSTTSNFHHIATTPSYLLQTSTDLPRRLFIPLTCTSASSCAIAKLVTAEAERRRKDTNTPLRDDNTAPRKYTTFSDRRPGSGPPTNASTPKTIRRPSTAAAPLRYRMPISSYDCQDGPLNQIVNGDGHHKKPQKRTEPSAYQKSRFCQKVRMVSLLQRTSARDHQRLQAGAETRRPHVSVSGLTLLQGRPRAGTRLRQDVTAEDRLRTSLPPKSGRRQHSRHQCNFCSSQINNYRHFRFVVVSHPGHLVRPGGQCKSRCCLEDRSWRTPASRPLFDL